MELAAASDRRCAAAPRRVVEDRRGLRGCRAVIEGRLPLSRYVREHSFSCSVHWVSCPFDQEVPAAAACDACGFVHADRCMLAEPRQQQATPSRPNTQDGESCGRGTGCIGLLNGSRVGRRSTKMMLSPAQ